MSGLLVNKDFTFTYERGTTWGSAIDTSPIGIPTEDGIEFTVEPNARRFNRAYGYRGIHEDNASQDMSGVVPTAQVSMRVNPQILRDLLGGILQNSGSWPVSSDVYDMITRNYADLPRPKKGGNGYYYTIARQSPDGTDEYISSAIPSALKLSISPADNDGQLMGEWQFIGKDYHQTGSLIATIAHSEVSGCYKWSNIDTVSFGDVNITTDFVSAEINVTQNAKFAGEIPDGEVVFPQWDVNGTIKVLANTNTNTMKNKVLNRDAGQAEQLIIGFGTGSAPEKAGFFPCYFHGLNDPANALSEWVGTICHVTWLDCMTLYPA